MIKKAGYKGSWCTVASQSAGWPGTEYGEGKTAEDFMTAVGSFAGFRPGADGQQMGFSNKLVDLANLVGGVKGAPISTWLDENFNMYVWNKNGWDMIMACKGCNVHFHCHICAGDRKVTVHEWKDLIGQDIRNFWALDQAWFQSAPAEVAV